MSQIADIQTAQNSLEESFTRRMAELEAQLHSAGNSKDTVARVSEEFRTFRELMFSMLSLLRKQIGECVKMVDVMETRHRHKALIILGVPEAIREDCSGTLLNIINQQMGLKDITPLNIRFCHRIGAPNKEHRRPILVRFCTAEVRSSIWKAKTTLKGTGFSVREFLTKIRQTVFNTARQHFGMSACWTQDGTIVVKTPDNSRHKITSSDELKPLMVKYPKVISTGRNDFVIASSGSNAKSSRRQ